MTAATAREESSNVNVSSASIDKLRRYEENVRNNSSNYVETVDDKPACIIIEVEAISTIFSSLSCMKCNRSNLRLDVRQLGDGIVASLDVYCPPCDKIVTSGVSGKLDGNPSRSRYALCRQITMEMGVGYAGLEKFSSIMGMPCMHQKTNVNVSSASIDKLRRYEENVRNNSSNYVETVDDKPACIIIEVEAISTIFSSLRCNRSNLRLDVRQLRDGIVASLDVYCPPCDKIVTSGVSGKLDGNPSRSPYALCRRITMEMGVGYAGLEKFSSIMGMPCMHQKTFVHHSKTVGIASLLVAQDVMSDAATMVRKAYMELNTERGHN